MAESIATLETRLIKANPENPRLIFHQEELEALQESIEKQGILVPLTVYVEKSNYIILDGERRWRCAIKLGLSVVPAIVQPKPAPLQNLMMMFAIHHRRNEWDPLPTALKLQRLEELYVKKYEARPTEKQLAEIASLTRGEVRRYKKLLSLPESYIKMLMEELMKPRSQQILTVDHVLEATAAASSLRKRGVVDDVGENVLRSSIVDKFKSGVIDSTVAPRKLARLARAVEREEVSLKVASKLAVCLLHLAQSARLRVRTWPEEVEVGTHVQRRAATAAAIQQPKIHRRATAVARTLCDVAIGQQPRLVQVRVLQRLAREFARVVHPGHEGLHRAYWPVAVVEAQAKTLRTQILFHPRQRFRHRGQQVTGRSLVARNTRAGEVVGTGVADIHVDTWRHRPDLHQPGVGRAGGG